MVTEKFKIVTKSQMKCYYNFVKQCTKKLCEI